VATLRAITRSGETRSGIGGIAWPPPQQIAIGRIFRSQSQYLNGKRVIGRLFP
jgi:hypothetical protein